MKQIIPTKKHLLVKRAKIINFLETEGYSGEEIGIMFGIDRSTVSRILDASKQYKNSVKNLLTNKQK